jgi:hypothetical protein
MNQDSAMLELYMISWDIKDAYPLNENKISKDKIDRFNRLCQNFRKQKTNIRKDPEITESYERKIKKLTAFVIKLENHFDYLSLKRQKMFA